MMESPAALWVPSLMTVPVRYTTPQTAGQRVAARVAELASPASDWAVVYTLDGLADRLVLRPIAPHQYGVFAQHADQPAHHTTSWNMSAFGESARDKTPRYQPRTVLDALWNQISGITLYVGTPLAQVQTWEHAEVFATWLGAVDRVQVNVRCPDDLKTRLQEAAGAHGVSFNELAIAAWEYFLHHGDR